VVEAEAEAQTTKAEAVVVVVAFNRPLAASSLEHPSQLLLGQAAQREQLPHPVAMASRPVSIVSRRTAAAVVGLVILPNSIKLAVRAPLVVVAAQPVVTMVPVAERVKGT
jgi:hypothetical protein